MNGSLAGQAYTAGEPKLLAQLAGSGRVHGVLTAARLAAPAPPRRG